MQRNERVTAVLTILLFAALTVNGFAQEIEFGVHADPLITWMSSNSDRNITMKVQFPASASDWMFYYPLNENYAVSSGIRFLSSGGRQSAVEDHTMVFNNIDTQLLTRERR